MGSSKDNVMKLVWSIKDKEDQTTEACLRSLKNVTTLTREIEEHNMQIVDKLMKLQQTPTRDEAVKYFKTQLGGNSRVRVLLKEVVDELEEKKKKTSEDVETLISA